MKPLPYELNSRTDLGKEADELKESCVGVVESNQSGFILILSLMRLRLIQSAAQELKVVGAEVEIETDEPDVLGDFVIS